MKTSAVVTSTLAIGLLASPSAAGEHIAGSYMMSRPIAGESGGADHAAVVRFEHLLTAELDVGVAVQTGHSAGNDDESLTRLALLPTLGMRGVARDFVVRADLAIGWQLAHGRTKFAGVPARGTEPRGMRAELGFGVGSALSTWASFRARAGLVLDGVYPRTLMSSSQLGPFVELGVAFAL